MSLDKSIKSGKEHRKPYKGAKDADRTCRNHGSCSHCENNRKYALIKSKEKSDESIKEYLGE